MIVKNNKYQKEWHNATKPLPYLPSLPSKFVYNTGHRLNLTKILERNFLPNRLNVYFTPVIRYNYQLNCDFNKGLQ
jgi:hypothetical protein